MVTASTTYAVVSSYIDTARSLTDILLTSGVWLFSVPSRDSCHPEYPSGTLLELCSPGCWCVDVQIYRFRIKGSIRLYPRPSHPSHSSHLAPPSTRAYSSHYDIWSHAHKSRHLFNTQPDLSPAWSSTCDVSEDGFETVRQMHPTFDPCQL